MGNIDVSPNVGEVERSWFDTILSLRELIEEVFNVPLGEYLELIEPVCEWVGKVKVFNLETYYDERKQLEEYHTYLLVRIMRKLGIPVKSFFKSSHRKYYSTPPKSQFVPPVLDPVFDLLTGVKLKLKGRNIIVLGSRIVSGFGGNKEEEILEVFYVYEEEWDTVLKVKEDLEKDLELKGKVRHVIENL